MTIGRNIGAGYGCILLLLLVLAGVVLYRTNSINKQFTYVIEHDAPVIANARHLSKLVVDMETGQRGYVITGNEEYLEPYHAAILGFEALIEIEKQLVSDNPSQVKALEQIESAVAEWQERAAKPEILIRRTIAEKKYGANTLKDMLIGDAGSGALDEIIKVADELEEAFLVDGNMRGVFLIKSLEKSIIDQETGQRGFLITGQENFLEPYASGQEDFASTVAQLHALVESAHDRDATILDIDELDNLHQQWLTEAAMPEIAMRRSTMDIAGQTANDVQEEIENTQTSRAGKKILDDMRVILSRLDDRFRVSENEQMHSMAIALAKSIVDQETGQLGFLLTGREEFLQPFYGGKEHWQSIKADLLKLNSNAYVIAEMNAGLGKLEILAKEWLSSVAEPEIAIRREMDSHPETLEDVAAHIEGGDGKRILDRIRMYVEGFIEEEHRLTALRYKKASTSFAQTNIVTVSIVLLSILIGGGVGLRISRGITRPMRVLSEGLYAVAQGRETKEIQRTSNDEIGELTDTFNQMVRDLKELESDREIAIHDLAAAKDAAESANQAKSEFLANMSHEIRTPMTAILGFADIVRENVSVPETVMAITTVRKNGEYLLEIINNILDLSKIEAGKADMEIVPFNPCELVADVVSLMKVRADSKSIGCDLEYIGRIPKVVNSDPTRLRQILINLIGNAIKFTEEGGVRLAVRFNEQGGDEANAAEATIQFDVLDTGRGMTKEQADRLFKPFTQADNSTTRKYGGTGLGLTISKRFAEMLGGNVSLVQSKVSEGSRFRAVVETGPVAQADLIDKPAVLSSAAVHTSKPATISAGALDGLHILVAEDGYDNQRLIKHMLTKVGATVVVVENGKLAYEKAMSAYNDNKPFDVILMDMQMPVMDGYTASAQLRQSGYPFPIIALTAHAMGGDRDKCLSAGCNDYSTKPIDWNKLYQAILHLNSSIKNAA